MFASGSRTGSRTTPQWQANDQATWESVATKQVKLVQAGGVEGVDAAWKVSVASLRPKGGSGADAFDLGGRFAWDRGTVIFSRCLDSRHALHRACLRVHQAGRCQKTLLDNWSPRLSCVSNRVCADMKTPRLWVSPPTAVTWAHPPTQCTVA